MAVCDVSADGEGGPQRIGYVLQGGVRQCACCVEDFTEGAAAGSHQNDVEHIGVGEANTAEYADVLLGDLVGLFR